MNTGIIIINPNAGPLSPRLWVKSIENKLKQLGWTTQTHFSTSGEEITRLANTASIEGTDAVFIMGGDGSVNCAIAGLVHSNTALGVLPLGTSNVIAQEIGLKNFSPLQSHRLLESLEKLVTGDIVKVDIGKCNEKYFIAWAGYGLDGLVVTEIESKRKRWKKSFPVPEYLVSILRNSYNYPGIHLKVQTPNELIEGHFLLGITTNISRYAGGLARFSDDISMVDGWFDLWLFPGAGTSMTVKHAVKLLLGKHKQDPTVKRIIFKSITIQADQKNYYQLDGDPGGFSDRLEIQVVPSALKLLIPKN